MSELFNFQKQENTGQLEADGGEAYQLHDNFAVDLVRYSRSKQIKNEQQFLLMTYGYLSGLFENPSHFICTVAIGTSSSGKSNMQDKIEDIFPDDWLYQASTGADNSITYDSEWENCLIASLDELNKPSDELIEVLKGLHGDDEEFTRKATTNWQEEEVKTTTRTSKPYHFLFAQFSPDFELWNRLLKIPVDESKAKNEAVVDTQFDHSNIAFEGNEHEYIFDFVEGEEAIKEHIRNMPKNGWVKLPAGEDEYGWNVAEIVKPILDMQRSEVNRVSAMIANLIRASAHSNYKNRQQKDIYVPNEGVKENAVIAEPQDVANVLSCRDILIASTHEVDRKKMSICEAIKDKGGKKGKATIDDITDYIEDTNIPKLKKSQINGMLEDMIDNNLISKHEQYGDDDMYSFGGWHKFGEIEITPEIEELFADCEDPIEQRPFLETLQEINKGFRGSMSDFLEADSVSSGSSSGSGQQALVAETVDVELEPHEEAVYEAVKESIDGRLFRDVDPDDISTYEMVGVVPIGGNADNPQIEGSVMDPAARHWDQQSQPNNWIEDAADAKDEVKKAMDKLHEEGVLNTEIIQKHDNGNVTIEVEIKDV